MDLGDVFLGRDPTEFLYVLFSYVQDDIVPVDSVVLHVRFRDRGLD